MIHRELNLRSPKFASFQEKIQGFLNLVQKETVNHSNLSHITKKLNLKNVQTRTF